ncbi:preprotein translocase subunit YajC [Streptomyces yaizuensis]|uniref:Preprotein translocase subunit YajC n=1 Tax=Streptomyces yaizuensis TaxID=2989713 RepID=A0ABQ5P1J2_9ACTN|nr:preprotein translocase subunit YajC [Streptomyces sp. YSPA8]GLF96367.1 preprotein translocase subunit YajC [Streptomyces sp. YSPA8]
MSLAALLPFIVLIGAMFLMTRSAKKKQQQAADMRNSTQPGSGVRTIGGMYATVKEVHEDTVLLEVAPGVHAVYAKNAIGAVLDDEEYNRIVHGDEAEAEAGSEAAEETPVVPDDVSSLTGAEDGTKDATTSDDAGSGAASTIDLGKKSEGNDSGTKDATGETPKDDRTDGGK